jgi:hypothetical protein
MSMQLLMVAANCYNQKLTFYTKSFWLNKVRNDLKAKCLMHALLVFVFLA